MEVGKTLWYREREIFNPLHPNISMHILHSVLYTFPKIQIRRTYLTIKIFLVGDHFLYSCDLYMWLRGNTVGRNSMLITLKGHVKSISQYPCSPYCFLYISYSSNKENLFYNQELLHWWSFPFILIIQMFYLRLTL